jgi:hypothetical protein
MPHCSSSSPVLLQSLDGTLQRVHSLGHITQGRTHCAHVLLQASRHVYGWLTDMGQ